MVSLREEAQTPRRHRVARSIVVTPLQAGAVRQAALRRTALQTRAVCQELQHPVLTHRRQAAATQPLPAALRQAQVHRQALAAVTHRAHLIQVARQALAAEAAASLVADIRAEHHAAAAVQVAVHAADVNNLADRQVYGGGMVFAAIRLINNRPYKSVQYEKDL